MLRSDISRLRAENQALRVKVLQLRGEGVDVEMAGVQDTLVDARGQVASNFSGALLAQAHAMNGAVLRLLD
jgi:hypothetical protein